MATPSPSSKPVAPPQQGTPVIGMPNLPGAPTPLSILLVEDDVDLAQMLVEFMGDENHTFTLAHDGVAALGMLVEQTFDLVLLDVMLPRADGFELLRAVRRRSQVPVIMMTARTAAADRIAGLELGADDYVCKPVDPQELLARIRAVLRRTNAPAAAGREMNLEPDAIVLGPLRVVPSTQRASLFGIELGLTAAELRVLDMLVRQAGTPVSREELTEVALGRSLSAYDRSLDTHVSNLRRKLRRAADVADAPNVPDAAVPEIRGLRSFGYVVTAVPLA